MSWKWEDSIFWICQIQSARCNEWKHREDSLLLLHSIWAFHSFNIIIIILIRSTRHNHTLIHLKKEWKWNTRSVSLLHNSLLIVLSPIEPSFRIKKRDFSVYNLPHSLSFLLSKETSTPTSLQQTPTQYSFLLLHTLAPFTPLPSLNRLQSLQKWAQMREQHGTLLHQIHQIIHPHRQTKRQSMRRLHITSRQSQFPTSTNTPKQECE